MSRPRTSRLSEITLARLARWSARARDAANSAPRVFVGTLSWAQEVMTAGNGERLRTPVTGADISRIRRAVDREALHVGAVGAVRRIRSVLRDIAKETS